MFRIVGYRDLRPLDWVSGKRMPLEPGAGHLCDRCGREHAVLYEVLDEETNKTYVVGSGCAQKQFGFEVEKNTDAKDMIKKTKLEAELAIDELRHQIADSKYREVLKEISSLPVPETTTETRPYGLIVVFVGDGLAYANHRSVEETTRVATRDWLHKRISERIPPEWDKISLSNHPPAKTTRDLRHQTSMGQWVTYKCLSHFPP